MVLNRNAQPGDEARHTGDEIGLPNPETEQVKKSNLSIPKGYPVTHDGTEIAMVTGDNTDDVAGVVYEYPVFGGNQGSGNEQLVRPDRPVTVKMRGMVYADLEPYVNGTATVEEGASLGPNGEILVIEEAENGDNLYEVLIR